MSRRGIASIAAALLVPAVSCMADPESGESCGRLQARSKAVLTTTGDAADRALSPLMTEMQAQGCVSLAEFERLLALAEIQSKGSRLRQALVEADAASAAELFVRSITADPDLEQPATRDTAAWLPRLTRACTSPELFAVVSPPQEPASLELEPLEARVAIARSFVCSKRAEVEVLSLRWNARLDRAIDEESVEVQRALGVRAEMNRLLFEVGTRGTLDALVASATADLDYAPSWLLIDAFDLLGRARHRAAFALLDQVVRSDRQEIPTRLRALQSLIAIANEDQRGDVQRAALDLAEAAEREGLLQEEVESLLASLAAPGTLGREAADPFGELCG